MARLSVFNLKFPLFSSILYEIFYNLILGIRDDTGALSDALTTKYLGYAVDSCQMGNLTVMLPGLIDVS